MQNSIFDDITWNLESLKTKCFFCDNEAEYKLKIKFGFLDLNHKTRLLCNKHKLMWAIGGLEV